MESILPFPSPFTSSHIDQVRQLITAIYPEPKLATINSITILTLLYTIQQLLHLLAATSSLNNNTTLIRQLSVIDTNIKNDGKTDVDQSTSLVLQLMNNVITIVLAVEGPNQLIGLAIKEMTKAVNRIAEQTGKNNKNKKVKSSGFVCLQPSMVHDLLLSTSYTDNNSIRQWPYDTQLQQLLFNNELLSAAFVTVVDYCLVEFITSTKFRGRDEHRIAVTDIYEGAVRDGELRTVWQRLGFSWHCPRSAYLPLSVSYSTELQSLIYQLSHPTEEITKKLIIDWLSGHLHLPTSGDELFYQRYHIRPVSYLGRLLEAHDIHQDLPDEITYDTPSCYYSSRAAEFDIIDDVGMTWPCIIKLSFGPNLPLIQIRHRYTNALLVESVQSPDEDSEYDGPACVALQLNMNQGPIHNSKAAADLCSILTGYVPHGHLNAISADEWKRATSCEAFKIRMHQWREDQHQRDIQISVFDVPMDASSDTVDEKQAASSKSQRDEAGRFSELQQATPTNPHHPAYCYMSRIKNWSAFHRIQQMEILRLCALAIGLAQPNPPSKGRVIIDRIPTYPKDLSGVVDLAIYSRHVPIELRRLWTVAALDQPDTMTHTLPSTLQGIICEYLGEEGIDLPLAIMTGNTERVKTQNDTVVEKKVRQMTDESIMKIDREFFSKKRETKASPDAAYRR